MISHPVFIVGAQRSGTTLVRLILNANSAIAIPEEGTFWMPLLRRYRRSANEKIAGISLHRTIKYIKSNAQFRLWGLDQEQVFNTLEQKDNGFSLADLMCHVYGYYAKFHHKNLWGDKTPSFFRMIPVLHQLFPTARFIHVVRDGRDAYLSWRTIDASKKNISLAALEWTHKVRRTSLALDNLPPDQNIIIRYEDLVVNPESTVRKLCSFLRFEYEDKMLAFWETSNRYIGSHHSDLIFQPVSPCSVAKWKREFSKEEICNFQLIAKNTLISLGYESAEVPGSNPICLSRVALQLMSGLPVRMAQVFLTFINLKICAKFGLGTEAAGKGVLAKSVRDYDSGKDLR